MSEEVPILVPDDDKPHQALPEPDENHDDVRVLGFAAAKVAPRSTRQAKDYLKGQHDDGGREWRLLCLKLQRIARGLPAVYSSAWIASQAVPMSDRVTNLNDIKIGMVGFSKGSNKFGHIFFFAAKAKDGEWLVYTNDALVPGGVSLVRLSFFKKNWGHYFQFASRSLNGYSLPGVEPTKPHPEPTDVLAFENVEYAVARLKKAIAYWKTQGRDDIVAALKEEKNDLEALMRKFREKK